MLKDSNQSNDQSSGAWQELKVTNQRSSAISSSIPIDLQFDTRNLALAAATNDIEAKVICSDDNRQIPCTLERGSSGRHAISFAPYRAGLYTVTLTMNAIPIKGSAFKCDLIGFNPELVQIRNLKDRLEVGERQTFQLVYPDARPKNLHGFTSPELVVVLIESDGNRRPLDLKLIKDEKDETIYETSFVANEIGDYTIDITTSQGHRIPQSPAIVTCFNSKLVRVKPDTTGVLDETVNIEIDASECGAGQLEVSVQNGLVPCHAKNVGHLQFNASYVAQHLGENLVHITFNNIPVIGSPFLIMISDVKEIELVGKAAEYAEVNEPSTCYVLLKDLPATPLTITIVSPSGRKLLIEKVLCTNSTITRNENDEETYRKLLKYAGQILQINFCPTEIGTHYIEMNYNDIPLRQSPYQLIVYDVSKVYLTKLYPSIGIVGEEEIFGIDATQAGEGQLEIAINNAVVPHVIKTINQEDFLQLKSLTNNEQRQQQQQFHHIDKNKELSKGYFHISFIPEDIIDYCIDVKFNGKHVPLSPMNLKVIDIKRFNVEGPALEQLEAGYPTWLKITSNGNYISSNNIDLSSICKVCITTPSGDRITPRHRSNSINELICEFTSYEVGTYEIDVTINDKHICQSPYIIKCFDASKIIVTDISEYGRVNERQSFNIDASEAGDGNLEISINCVGTNIPNQVRQVGSASYEVTYVPTTIAEHRCNIKFNDVTITGSPFITQIFDPCNVTLTGRKIEIVPVNQPTQFTLSTLGAGPGELKCSVIGL
ncbi:hypothetical protein SNEBB_005484 [Seison nebaliae]|nr:hypothetical protein SNEBB_005484 [Seison nebaliae]